MSLLTPEPSQFTKIMSSLTLRWSQFKILESVFRVEVNWVTAKMFSVDGLQGLDSSCQVSASVTDRRYRFVKLRGFRLACAVRFC